MGPGADLQAALDSAAPGDTLVLAAGASYVGNFVLPPKPGSSFITIRSAALDALPAGRRVTPANAASMPKLITPNTVAAVSAAPASHHFRFQGIEFGVGPGVYIFDVILLGGVTETGEDIPHDFEFDRVFVHGDPAVGGKRGMFMNARSVVLTNSYFSDFKSKFQDAMALCACNGPGPFRIVNNYLEGSGYPVLFGGCENVAAENLPSDLTFVHNRVTRPLIWKSEGWSVKNLFEMKAMRRAFIDGNIFENNWVSAQNGYAILMTVRADYVDSSGAPYSAIEDVTFSNNRVINSPNGLVILGHDDGHNNAGLGRRITIRNNVFQQVTGSLFFFVGTPQSITVDHNTSVDQGNMMLLLDNDQKAPGSLTGLAVTNNILAAGQYGIFGSGLASGNPTLAALTAAAVFTGNVFIGAVPSSRYPPDNFYPASVDEVGFVNPAQGDYTLAPTSAFKGRAGGNTDPGATLDTLFSVTQGILPTSIATAVNTASLLPDVSPGARLTITGQALADCIQEASFPLTQTLCGASVKIQSQPAFLYYASPDMLIAQLPSALPLQQEVTVQVTRNGTASNTLKVPAAAVHSLAPALYGYPLSGGMYNVLAVSGTNALNGPANRLLNRRPFQPGETVTLLVNGLGLTDPAIPDGAAAAMDAPLAPLYQADLYINDQKQPILFAGVRAGTGGVYEIQFRIDAATPIRNLLDNQIWVTSRGVESPRLAISLVDRLPLPRRR